MKTRSIFLSLLFAATTFALWSNCSGKKEEVAETEAHEEKGHEHDGKTEHASEMTVTEASEPQFQVEAAFQNQLTNVFTSYISLKEALISSNANEVTAEVPNVQKALGKVDMKLVSGAAHNDWMNYMGRIESSLTEIQVNKDIEAQRKSFRTLSENLHKTIKAYGLGGKDVFYQFCPMAFNNEGAHWLSEQEKIRNPYFGDKMLTCGAVKEKLK